ncbi:MAG: TVP38/TMEM64 family protein [Clostridia bacterium]|nr:TVP38/TMEM64 family protein [Clostridia bacterium]
MKQTDQPSAVTRQSRIRGILIIAAIVAVTALLLVFVGQPLLDAVRDPESFRAWVEEKGAAGRLVYVGMVLVQIVIAFIPGDPFEIVAGYAFGAVEGTVLCLLASSVGSMIVFFLVRRYGMRLVRLFFSEEQIDSVSFLKSTPNRNIIYFLIFLCPGTPKDLLCYIAGLTDISPWLWLLISSVGRIPAVVTSTIGGSALGEKNYTVAVIVFAVTLLISGAGILTYRIICKKRAANGKTDGQKD